MGQSTATGKTRRYLGNAVASSVFAFLTLYSVVSAAAISDVPLAVSTGADPNIVFILDDSGSMGWEYMPDSISGDYSEEYYYSSRVNKVWFDPDVDYKPPFKADGSERFPDSSYTSAWTNGYSQTGSKDLSDEQPHRGISFTNGGFYYEYDDTNAGCSGQDTDNDCYNYVSVNNLSDAVKENFANWFSYYRIRQYAARAGISEAFLTLNDEVRLGWGAINETGTLVQRVRPYNDSAAEDFRDWLYSRPANGGTPLRKSLENVGDYYEETGDDGPWSDDPVNGVSDGSHVECRQSFSVLMTDGFWGGDAPSVDNSDNTSGSLISNPAPGGDDFQYQPVHPFKDNTANTLADVAMHYWKRDLRPDVSNEVPNSTLNPAFWQHMVTYGVGLGVTGSVDPDDAFAAIENNDPVAWKSVNTDKGKIDDLLHAAVNSRGGFFSAGNPELFAKELGNVLKNIQARVESSSSAAAASSAVLNDDSDRFRAGFRSGDWSGTLVAENIETGAEKWNAEPVLASNSSRNLFTHDGSGGVALSYTNLAADQQDALDTAPDGTTDDQGTDRLSWLEGTEIDAFRDRMVEDEQRVLGDIVNSNPQIDRKRNFGHAQLPDGDYNGYRNSDVYQDRPNVLYVGANDGFLHAFDTSNGEELFAYMPGSLLRPEGGTTYAPINELMEKDYQHRFFVDGTPTIADAFINGQWRTVLIGAMGVGGDRVFALDISEPESFDQSDILWEFSHSDLDRGVQSPQVGRLATGDWAAVFGNGVAGNSGTLFVVNLETGNVIETLDGGTAGLAPPVFTTNDGIIEYAYAGNLDGELFRFDLSDSNTNKWGSTKLFQTEADNADADPQPITARPRVANMPNSLNKRVISFGTGSFFQSGDRADSSEQSLYGIIDEDGSSSGITRSNLVEQTILEDATETVDVTQDDGSTVQKDFTVRRISENPLTDSDEGWVLDLDTVAGERVVSQATFPSGLDRSRVRFSTLIPDSDPCNSGTDGFLMDISLVSGGRANEPVFDLSKDGDFAHEDVSGVRSILGGEQLTTIRDGDKDKVVDPAEEPAPDLKGGDLGVGRQSWEQLR